VSADGLPNGWVRTTIAEVFDTAGGGTPSTAISEYWKGTIPWISSADIDENHHIEVRRHITKAAVDSSATIIVPKGSVIVVTRVGLGKVAIAPEPICYSQDSQALLFIDGLLNPQYVCLLVGFVAAGFKQISRGTTISGITTKQLKETEFLLPPTAEQHRIVETIEALLTDLDAAVAGLKRVQANLKRYRASVLKAACEGRLVPTEAELACKEGRSYESGEQLLQRILKERRAKWEADQLAKMHAFGKPSKNDDWKKQYKEPTPPDTTALPELPEGWTWANVEQLTLANSGLATGPFGTIISKSDQQENGVPVVGIPNITESGFISGDWFYLSSEKEAELHQFSLQSGDVVVSRSGTVGQACKIPDEAGLMIMSTNLMRMRTCERFDLGAWLVTNFKGNAVISHQIQDLCKGSTRPFLNQTILASLLIAMPPVGERERISGELELCLFSIRETEKAAEINVKRSTRLRQAILKRAFEGKLVPQDPNDEPASVLLERIRAWRDASGVSSRSGRNTVAHGVSRGKGGRSKTASPGGA
jgi:type I restriction enzyme, S subunit